VEVKLKEEGEIFGDVAVHIQTLLSINSNSQLLLSLHNCLMSMNLWRCRRNGGAEEISEALEENSISILGYNQKCMC